MIPSVSKKRSRCETSLFFIVSIVIFLEVLALINADPVVLSPLQFFPSSMVEDSKILAESRTFFYSVRDEVTRMAILFEVPILDLALAPEENEWIYLKRLQRYDDK
jgi:hypothetical protein